MGEEDIEREGAMALDLDKRNSKQMDNKEVVLSAVGTIREAATILKTHFLFFSLIQLPLTLPLMVLLPVSDWVSFHSQQHWSLAWSLLFPIWAAITLPPDQDGPAVLAAATPHNVPLILDLTIRMAVLAILLVVSIGVTFTYQALVCVCSSAVRHAVGVHYSGRRVSYVDVVRAAVPGSWMRLTVTNTIICALWLLVVFAGLTPSVLLKKTLNSTLLLSLMPTLLNGMFFFSIVLMPAGCVAVLEKEDHGWAPCRRAMDLLKGRVGAAVSFQFVWGVLSLIIVGACRASFQYEVRTGGNWVLQVLFGALYGYCALQYWTMYDLCACVQYVSFRAFHNEDLTESMPFFGNYEGTKRVFDDVAKGERESLVKFYPETEGDLLDSP